MQNVKLRLQKLKNEATERRKHLSNYSIDTNSSSSSSIKPSDELNKFAIKFGEELTNKGEKISSEQQQIQPRKLLPLPDNKSTVKAPQNSLSEMPSVPNSFTKGNESQSLVGRQPSLPIVSTCTFGAAKMHKTKKVDGKQPVDQEKNASAVQLPNPNQSMSTRTIIVNGKTYNVLGSIGKGGSSSVYQAYSEWHKRCVAIKCVDLSTADKALRKAYENETNLLVQLQDSPNVIRLFDHEKRKNLMLVVMECGDIDLATFMHKRATKIDAKFIKYHWQELLKCVKAIHDKNIVHSDLKPANFLFVGASLKLIDFGIASKIPSNKTSVVKEVQVGTLNYMSPEAIIGSYVDDNGVTIYKVPLKSDVWSLGCILYAMVYGHTPFQHFNNQMAKITAISSESHPIQFKKLRDPDLFDVLKKCLVRNLRYRATVDELLEHQYLKDPLLATPSPRVASLNH